MGYDYVGLNDLNAGTRVKHDSIMKYGIESQLTFINKVILDCAINCL